MNWKKVLGTHEESQTLSTYHSNPKGQWLGDYYSGVALPSVKALGKWLIVRCGDKWTCARVSDVGPWCQDDDDYVFGTERPRAEILKGEPCPRIKGTQLVATLPDGTKCDKSNGAGIDLFPEVARSLGIPIGTNLLVEWAFIDEIWSLINPHVG